MAAAAAAIAIAVVTVIGQSELPGLAGFKLRWAIGDHLTVRQS